MTPDCNTDRQRTRDSMRRAYIPADPENPRTAVPRHTLCSTFARGARGAVFEETTHRRAKSDRADLNMLASSEAGDCLHLESESQSVQGETSIDHSNSVDCGRSKGDFDSARTGKAVYPFEV